MAITFLHIVCVILIVLDESTALNIDGSLCLETIIKFMYDKERCDLNQENAAGLLNDKNITCQTKCQVTIKNIHSYGNKLEKVELRFGYKSYEYEPCGWTYNTHTLNMNIICPAWDKVKVPIGGYCKQDEQCHGSKTSGVCQLGKCVCRAGYLLYNLECHEGNLALNQSCSFGEQCTGSPYASCLGGKCSCIDGYTAGNATSCGQSQKSIFPKFQQQEEANIGTTLGALFGGLLLGVVLTAVVVGIIYRRSETHVIKRDELTVKFSDNGACSSANVVDPKDFQCIQTKNKKREVPPYTGSEETSIYNNVYGKPENGQTQDHVYNHLHEQVKQDDVDFYDHTCPASAHIGDMGDYSHLRHTTS